MAPIIERLQLGAILRAVALLQDRDPAFVGMLESDIHAELFGEPPGIFTLGIAPKEFERVRQQDVRASPYILCQSLGHES